MCEECEKLKRQINYVWKNMVEATYGTTAIERAGAHRVMEAVFQGLEGDRYGNSWLTRGTRFDGESWGLITNHGGRSNSS